MPIKLIAIDIDGTLINSKNQLTQATVDALETAAKAGIHICISTGRPVSECREYIALLPGMRYMVTCTGTQVVDLQTGKDIFRKALSADELRMLYKIIRRYNAIKGEAVIYCLHYISVAVIHLRKRCFVACC